MSYILDALKKSEQERGRGDIPGVQTVHSSSLNYHGQKKAYWPYFLIVAVLLNLIAIVYFIVDKEQTAPAEVSTQPVTANDLAEQPMDHDTAMAQAAHTENVADENNSHQQPDAPTSVTTTVIDSSIKSDDGVETKQASSAEQVIASGTTEPEPAARPATRPVTRSAPAVSEKQVIEFYDLPAAIKQQLPAIIISAHVYSSNPLQRSIVINNNFMEEGEYVIDDLRLHEITPDGAIFDFRDTRFHHGVVSSWQ
jgi:general secretion pathway protein B